MKRISWLTDVHLDHTTQARRNALFEEVREARVDAVLLGGDISNAAYFARHLLEFRQAAQTLVYFVIGNHDCYGGSIEGTRELARGLSRRQEGLTWLSEAGVIALSETTALVGHDCWGDGGFGNAATTPVRLNDFLMIDELRRPRRQDLLVELARLGAEAGASLGESVAEAAARFPKVIVLTHVPPFAEAAWHDGQQSNADWLPFFACRAAGEALSAVAARFPSVTITVLCGHTHGGGQCRVNGVDVITGPAVYGDPRIQSILSIE